MGDGDPRRNDRADSAPRRVSRNFEEPIVHLKGALMKHENRLALFVFLVCLILIPSQAAIAGCWECESGKCEKTCTGNIGYRECNYQTYCGSNGCINLGCTRWGFQCVGTHSCGGSCHQGIEECGPQNVGSLVVPNGEMPLGGSWLDRKNSELRLCSVSVRAPAGEEASAFGNPRSLLPTVEASRQSLSL